MNTAKILIVEDDQDLLRAYSRIVGQAGYEVWQAATGSECRRLFQAERPDLVLLDAVLPDALGIDLCRDIKSDLDSASTLVLMLSGHKTSPDHQESALAAGADVYLTKPVESKVLLGHLKSLLRIKEAEQNLRASREEYRLLAEELKAANTRLEEYNRLKAEFIANMSHELRTPLTAIIGFSQLFELQSSESELPPDCAMAFELIYRNGRHLLSLVDEVLDIAKIEAGRMRIHLEHFDLNSLVGDVFGELHSLALTKKLNYQLRIPEELPLALSDPLRIRQVILNLISNAIKFTDHGTVEIELLKAGEKEFRFVVRDTGIGIDQESVRLIFERFRQVDGSSTRNAGGAGLGLSISKQIVELLGGQIEVLSKFGEGSEFSVTLPLIVSEHETAPVELVESAPAQALETVLPEIASVSNGIDQAHSLADPKMDEKPLILIIEDDADMARLLSENVSQSGYRVRLAASGIEGLRLARELDLSAILLDVMMPGMDGWKVLQALKSDVQTVHIPVIICSIVDNRPRGYRLGASNYLIKPVEPEQLKKVLQSVSANDLLMARDGYVLVVDDEHGVRELLINALSRAGYNARAAASGEIALKMSAQIAPRAILSDLIMPGGMTGYELIVRMRANEKTEKIPIVVITGKDMSTEDRKFINNQIADVIRKGDLLMSDLETRLQQTLAEIGVHP